MGCAYYHINALNPIDVSMLRINEIEIKLMRADYRIDANAILGAYYKLMHCIFSITG